MKQTVQTEVHCCDACGKQQDYITTCLCCGTEHCYECRKIEGKEYKHSVHCSGSGDGYYCRKCDVELTKSRADKRHTAYRVVESLRNEAKAWGEDFEIRRKKAEATLEAMVQ